MKKTLPGSIEDYREVMEKNKYYVDKTLLIKELLDNDMKITLITRPRRFGKTLNMTMIREFFDITVDSKAIFEGMDIMSTDYASRINTVPVVYLTFKNCEGDIKEELIDGLKFVIKREYDRHYKEFKDLGKISKATLDDFDMVYKVLKDGNVDKEYMSISSCIKRSLVVLTSVMYEYYGIKPIVIIDEYDAPFIEAKTKGYYKDVRTTLSGLFGSTFKENTSIERGIMTGIQRIAQESIFSKFNNPDVCTVISPKYCDKFGLTREETKEYLEYFGFELNDEIKNYYDGYNFGKKDKKINAKGKKIYEKEVYNPMSITSYISNMGLLESYWVNTSSNTLIREEIENASEEFFEGFNDLIEKEECITDVDLITTFAEESSTLTLWGLLLNAGYVTIKGELSDGSYKLCIPNAEVRTEFKKIVAEYTKIGVKYRPKV